MIICHELSLIFIKTKKVGGTSFEIALSEFCGEDDVITPISPKDECLRKELGFRAAQNYRDTVWYELSGGQKVRYAQTKGEFFNHGSAKRIREMVPDRIWSDYKIISIVRSPFDAIISRYFWRGGEKSSTSFEDFVLENPSFCDENHQLTHIDGKPAIDVFLRFESLEEDISNLEAKLGIRGLWERFSGIRAKGDIRPRDGSGVREMFANAPKARELIEIRCAPEIERFGYRFPD